jgi:hypothetical protein
LSLSLNSFDLNLRIILDLFQWLNYIFYVNVQSINLDVPDFSFITFSFDLYSQTYNLSCPHASAPFFFFFWPLYIMTTNVQQTAAINCMQLILYSRCDDHFIFQNGKRVLLSVSSKTGKRWVWSDDRWTHLVKDVRLLSLSSKIRKRLTQLRSAATLCKFISFDHTLPANSWHQTSHVHRSVPNNISENVFPFKLDWKLKLA